MASNQILEFLRTIDAFLVETAESGETLDLYLLGRSALVLGFGVDLMTKDVDVVDIYESVLLVRALSRFGRESSASRDHGLYLEEVGSGLPPLPMGYQNRCVLIEGDWRVLRPKRPEIHDLATTKLARFHARDRQDIQILADTGDLTGEILRGRLESAFAFAADEDEDPKRKKAFVNLRIVIDYLDGRRQNL